MDFLVDTVTSGSAGYFLDGSGGLSWIFGDASNFVWHSGASGSTRSRIIECDCTRIAALPENSHSSFLPNESHLRGLNHDFIRCSKNQIITKSVKIEAVLKGWKDDRGKSAIYNIIKEV